MRYSESDDYVLFDEICHGSSYGLTKWYSLCLFGKVLYNHKDPYVLMRGWINWAH